MVTAPLASVLLPVGPGAQPFVERAIASTLAQSERRLEVCCVLDRTDPAVRQRLRRWRRRDGRVRLLASRGVGIVDALETGRAHARAPVLVRMDADDVMRPARIAAQLAWLADHPEAALCGSRVCPLGAGPGMARFCAWHNRLTSHEAIARARFAECPIAHPSWAVRARPLARLGGWRACDGPEDMDLICRAIEAGWRVGKLERELLLWRDHPQRLSRSGRAYRAEAFVRLRAEHLARALPSLARERSVLVWGAGRHGGRLGRALLERGVALAGFVDIDPRRIGSRRHGLPVLDGREPQTLPPAHEVFVVAAVGGEGGSVLRASLEASGRAEGRDWIAAAAPWPPGVTGCSAIS